MTYIKRPYEEAKKRYGKGIARQWHRDQPDTLEGTDGYNGNSYWPPFEDMYAECIGDKDLQDKLIAEIAKHQLTIERNRDRIFELENLCQDKGAYINEQAATINLFEEMLIKERKLTACLRQDLANSSAVAQAPGKKQLTIYCEGD